MLDIADFRYRPEYQWYEHELTLDGAPITISISDAQLKDAAALNARLNRAFEWIAGNFGAVQDYCAQLLLDVKNESWVNDESEQVTEAEFKKLLQIETIHIEADGSVELTLLDNDLFWGHWVVVRTDPEYRFRDVDLEG